jgi:hypothetical protein
LSYVDLSCLGVFKGTVDPNYCVGTATKRLAYLLQMENGSIVAVPQNPVYLSPDAPEVEQLLENAKARIALAVGTGKETIPDQIYAVGNFYTTVKVRQLWLAGLSVTDL